MACLSHACAAVGPCCADSPSAVRLCARLAARVSCSRRVQSPLQPVRAAIVCHACCVLHAHGGDSGSSSLQHVPSASTCQACLQHVVRMHCKVEQQSWQGIPARHTWCMSDCTAADLRSRPLICPPSHFTAASMTVILQQAHAALANHTHAACCIAVLAGRRTWHACLPALSVESRGRGSRLPVSHHCVAALS